MPSYDNKEGKFSLKIWMFVTSSVPKLTSKLRIKSKSIKVTHCYTPWEPPPEPWDMENNTSIYCMLFVYSLICLLFSDSFPHPCQAVGYLVMLSVCVSVCLFTCLCLHNDLRDQHHWEKPSWSMRALLDKSKDTASEQEPCSPSDILQSKTKVSILVTVI